MVRQGLHDGIPEPAVAGIGIHAGMPHRRHNDLGSTDREVRPGGLIGVISSAQGSISDNMNGRHEVYRSSKSALNQLMRSYAARHADDGRALLLMAPGWIRTDLGGPKAPFSVEESIPKVVDVLISKHGRPGLEYLDRDGNTVRW